MRGDRGQQPAQAGTDHIGADQQEQAATQVAGYRHRRPISLAAGLETADRRPPPVGVAQLVGATGHPPMLPRRPRLLGEPVDDRHHPPQAPGPRLRVRERRRQHPGHQQVTVDAAARPGRRNLPGRVTAMQPPHVRPGHAGHPGRAERRPARHGRRRRGRGHDAGLSNNAASDSARYPPPGRPASAAVGRAPSTSASPA